MQKEILMAGLTDAIIGQLVQNVIGQALGGNSTATTAAPAAAPTTTSNSGFDLSSIISALSGDKLTETAGKILTDQGVDAAKVAEAEKTNDPDLISSILGSIDPATLGSIATKILGAVTTK
jgi:hypothetical protein